MTTYQYNGDVDLTQGGYFASTGPDERRYGYSSVVRVTPCSDAGGPDNCFWIETLTVNLPTTKPEINQVLHHLDLNTDKLAIYTPAARRAILIDACIAYGKYDPDDLFSMGLPQRQMVRIGPADPYWSGTDDFTPDLVLRANWKLRNWVRQTYLKG